MLPAVVEVVPLARPVSSEARRTTAHSWQVPIGVALSAVEVVSQLQLLARRQLGESARWRAAT